MLRLIICVTDLTNATETPASPLRLYKSWQVFWCIPLPPQGNAAVAAGAAQSPRPRQKAADDTQAADSAATFNALTESAIRTCAITQLEKERGSEMEDRASARLTILVLFSVSELNCYETKPSTNKSINSINRLIHEVQTN